MTHEIADTTALTIDLAKLLSATSDLAHALDASDIDKRDIV